MSIPKITVGQAEKMEEVMKYFEEYEVWYIPVIDEDAQYVGFISKTVVLHQYRERLIETSDDV
jgi:CIC family chloride channel protein